MGAPELMRRTAAALALVVAGALAACASGGADQPAGLPAPQAVIEPPSITEPPGSLLAPPAPTPPPIAPAAPLDPAEERAKTLIVIETAEESDPTESQDLAAAARRERERRRSAETPIAVIDQKNLATWASGGVLTQAAESDTAPSPVEQAAVEVVEKAAAEEAYWRRRGREIRQRWHDADEQIAVLEAKCEALRTKFYSTDNGFQRDAEIKPEWDKAIADLEEARYTASRGQDEVLAFLEEGRRAGALPGWLREGSELEPEPVLETETPLENALEAREPVIYRDPSADTDQNEPPDSRPEARPRAE